MKKSIILFFMILGLNSIGYSQEPVVNSQQHHFDLMAELNGVYQIQMVNSRMKPMITTELLEQIKLMQSETEEVSFFYKDTIRIVIRSKQDVQNGLVYTDDEQIIYTNE